nr:YbaB/EbfC family nucleoid-associated protein [Domibacillus mangrovi]
MMRGGNMQNMMKQMQKMQKQMQEAQEELAEQTFEGSSGGGMVKIFISGQKQIVDVQIKEEVVDPEDIDMLQDLVLAAVNDALKKVEDETNQKMGQFTKGMNLPF